MHEAYSTGEIILPDGEVTRCGGEGGRGDHCQDARLLDDATTGLDDGPLRIDESIVKRVYESHRRRIDAGRNDRE